MNPLDSLQLEGNSIYLEGKKLSDLAGKYGTPLIVYSSKKIEENVNRLRGAFNVDYFSINFAIKSNYNPTILSILKKMGVGVDTANLNEVELALRVGFKRENIISTPNNLSREELAKISDHGVSINFDNIGQMESIVDNLPEVVSFRINPGIGKGEFPGTTTGGENSKFGIPVEEADNAYKTALNSGAHKFGIHMMTGSNVLDSDFFRESTRILFEVAEKISAENDIEFEYIDIGGGFGVPYREDEKELDIKSAARSILKNFESVKDRGYLKRSRLVAEPGRYIIANTGVLLTRVTNVKQTRNTYIGTDVSMNSLLRIPLYGGVHPIVPADKANEKGVKIVNVVGQVCENTDFIAKSVKLPDMKVGDVIAVLNAGAYVSSMASNYNLLKRPKELLLKDGSETVIKREETLDDMISTFSFPDVGL
jgi:diaminopimelate decarboxylase